MDVPRTLESGDQKCSASNINWPNWRALSTRHGENANRKWFAYKEALRNEVLILIQSNANFDIVRFESNLTGHINKLKRDEM